MGAPSIVVKTAWMSRQQYTLHSCEDPGTPSVNCIPGVVKDLEVIMVSIMKVAVGPGQSLDVADFETILPLPPKTISTASFQHRWMDRYRNRTYFPKEYQTDLRQWPMKKQELQLMRNGTTAHKERDSSP